jgi:tetratricopeptide (TPR) repeat protein/CHAT domain-containing protein
MMSIIGQQLLTSSLLDKALAVLQAAEIVGTDNEKLKASLMSALGTTYWKLGYIDKALEKMHIELEVATTLEDKAAECRALSNMGKCYQQIGNYEVAEKHHRKQVLVALDLNDIEMAASAMSSLGHTYYALKQYTQAFQCHEKCLEYAKDLDDAVLMSQELGNAGCCHLVLGDIDRAFERFEEQLAIASKLEDHAEEAKAYANLGAAYQSNRNFNDALHCNQKLLELAQEIGDNPLEARAYAGMGHANSSLGNLKQALACHKQQLNVSCKIGDSIGEAHSVSNLGNICQQLGNFDEALKYFATYLLKMRELKDKVGEARAYGNLGTTHSALGNHQEAVKFHGCMLSISRDIGDQQGEASTCGNLAIAYQALGDYDRANEFFQCQLDMAKKQQDTMMECQALNNMGNFLCLLSRPGDAVPYLKGSLELAVQLQDIGSQLKACGNLGKAYDSLGNIIEARNFYERAFTLAKQMENHGGMSTASVSLNQIYKTLGDFQKAVEHHEEVLLLSTQLKHVVGRCNALANLGDIYLNATDCTKAMGYYESLLLTSQSEKQRNFEAMAYRGLGNVYNEMGDHVKALEFYANDSQIRQELNEPVGLGTAYMNMGSAYNSLGRFDEAIECYKKKLGISRELTDKLGEASALGMLGIVERNKGNFQQALHYHREEYDLMMAGTNDMDDPEVLEEIGAACANLGDSYELLNQFSEAVTYHEQVLEFAQRSLNVYQEMRAYAGLGRSNLKLGRTHAAFMFFQHRLQLAIQQRDLITEAECYADMGDIQRVLGYHDAALDYHRQQLQIAQNLGDKRGESDAIYGLAEVCVGMGNYQGAVEYQLQDLELTREIGQEMRLLRVYSRLGFSYRMLGELTKAVECHVEAKMLAGNISKPELLCVACCDLGVDYRLLGEHDKALKQLEEGLNHVNLVPSRSGEHEAKLRHNMGLVLVESDNLQMACIHLYRSTAILDRVRREQHFSGQEDKELRKLQALGYARLQQALVKQGEIQEALCVAERAKASSFASCLLDRGVNPEVIRSAGLLQELSTFSVQDILATVKRTQGTFIYFSLVQDYLYTWVLTPDQGIVKFHEAILPGSMATGADSDVSDGPESNLSLVDHIALARHSLGIDMDHIRTTPSLTSHSLGDSRQARPLSPSLGSADGEDQRWPSIDQLDSLSGSDVGRSTSPTPEVERKPKRSKQLSPAPRRTKSPSPHRGRKGRIKSVIENDVSSDVVDEAAAVIAGSRAGSPVGTLTRDHHHYMINRDSNPKHKRRPPDIAVQAPQNDVDSVDHGGSHFSGSISSFHHDAQAWQCLYDLLLAPVESFLPEVQSGLGSHKLLVIVPDGDLYLVPFGVLHSSKEKHLLCHHYRLIVAPSLHALNNQFSALPLPERRLSLGEKKLSPSERFLVIGNPKAPPAQSKDVKWWGSLPGAEAEAYAIADLLDCRPVIKEEATMDRVLSSMPKAEVMHFATYMSWNLSVLVLAAPQRRGLNHRDSLSEIPELSEFLLTLDKILELSMQAKLVVIGASLRGSHGEVSADGVLSLTRAFLAAGAQCVLVPLWPVPEQALKLFMNAFYRALLQGSYTSRALKYAMRIMQESRRYAHPANWVGFVLVGNDVIIDDQKDRLAAALRVMLQYPEDNLQAFKAVKYFVTKAQERIGRGMTSAQFVEYGHLQSKIGQRCHGGWEDVLTCCGFQVRGMDAKAANGVRVRQPKSVIFFPEHDDSEIHQKCIDVLNALLGVNALVLRALAKLLRTPHISSALRSLVRSLTLLHSNFLTAIICIVSSFRQFYIA